MSNIRPNPYNILAVAASLNMGVRLSSYEALPDIQGPYLQPAGGGFFRARPTRARAGQPRLGRPPCHPGTITFHDLLVRKYGRRVADEIGRRYRRGDKNAIPKFEGRPA